MKYKWILVMAAFLLIVTTACSLTRALPFGIGGDDLTDLEIKATNEARSVVSNEYGEAKEAPDELEAEDFQAGDTQYIRSEAGGYAIQVPKGWETEMYVQWFYAQKDAKKEKCETFFMDANFIPHEFSAYNFDSVEEAAEYLPPGFWLL